MRSYSCSFCAQTLIAAGLLVLAPAAASAQAPRSAIAESFSPTLLSWSTDAPFKQAKLTIRRPGGTSFFKQFDLGPDLRLDLSGQADLLEGDGGYWYELVLLGGQGLEVLADGRADGGRGAVGSHPPPKALRPVARRIGNFTLLSGTVPIGDEDNPAQRDQVILDDLIVDGSACIGFDCVNGESFGFDTLRLKENNLRIKFQDTSASASFPTNDWQITINDSANGGANKFSIDDIDSGRTPFTIEAGAPSHSLYVDDGGRLGLGTNTPVVDVHIQSGDTPTHRLEQNGSSGFSPQTWDVAGNEAGFFIRDVTNGSTLPFRIRPSAPSSSIDIAGGGNVGMGTTSPQASLHVQRTDGSAQLRVEEASGTTATRQLLHLENNGQVQMALRNSDSGQSWNIGLDDVEGNADSFVISRPGTGGPELSILTNGEIRIGAGASSGLKVAPNGNVEISGTLAQGSSRAIKDNIQRVSPRAMLNRVAELPVLEWNYKTDGASVRHVGPMAEDFRAAFRLGKDSKHLAPGDVAGVALVAVQGLREVVQEKDRRIADLTSRIEQLECLVARLAENAAHQTTHDESRGTRP